jgi:molybdopterin-guanine dinucleotide biosynthesis protein
MHDHFVLAITGPAGAGKSTAAEKIAKQLDKCVNIDADHVKHMIVGGFYYDRASTESEKEWGFSEWALVGESIGLLAQNFQKHGFDVIINGYIDEPCRENIEKFVTITHKVLLLPHADTAVTRDAGRAEDVQQGEASVKRHHRHFSATASFKDFVRLDSTHLSVDETVSKILDTLKGKYETLQHTDA